MSGLYCVVLCVLMVIGTFALGCEAQADTTAGPSDSYPSIYVDEDGNLRLLAPNASVYVNDLKLATLMNATDDLGTTTSDLGDTTTVLSTQASIIADLSAALSTTNSALSTLTDYVTCRASSPPLSYPVGEYTPGDDPLGAAYRADVAADSLLVGGSMTSKWGGAVLAKNGLIYAAPRGASGILIIDPKHNGVDPISLNVMNTQSVGYSEIIEADNGKLYMIPIVATNVVIVNPAEDHSIDLTTISDLGTGYKWFGGAKVPNSPYIVCAPFSVNYALLINTATNAYDTTTLSNLLTGATARWSGTVAANNNKVYGIPYTSTYVLTINAATNNTFLTFAQDGINNKWNGGVLAPNNKIYGIPYSAGSVLVIDTTQDAVSFLNFATPTGTFKWTAGVLTSHGRIIGIPGTASTMLVIDTNSGTLDTTSYGITDSASTIIKWGGGVFVPELNRIYGTALSHEYVLQIDLDTCA